MRNKLLAIVNKYIHSKPMAEKITDDIMAELIPMYFDTVAEVAKDTVKILVKKNA
jgi:hypothetical protein